jgi:hypothetical protein
MHGYKTKKTKGDPDMRVPLGGITVIPLLHGLRPLSPKFRFMLW